MNIAPSSPPSAGKSHANDSSGVFSIRQVGDSVVAISLPYYEKYYVTYGAKLALLKLIRDIERELAETDKLDDGLVPRETAKAPGQYDLASLKAVAMAHGKGLRLSEIPVTGIADENYRDCWRQLCALLLPKKRLTLAGANGQRRNFLVINENPPPAPVPERLHGRKTEPVCG